MLLVHGAWWCKPWLPKQGVVYELWFTRKYISQLAPGQTGHASA